METLLKRNILLKKGSMNHKKFSSILITGFAFLLSTSLAFALEYKVKGQADVKIANSNEYYHLDIFGTSTNSTFLKNVSVRATLSRLGGGGHLDRIFKGTGELEYTTQANGNLLLMFKKEDGTVETSEIKYKVISGNDCTLINGKYKNGKDYSFNFCINEYTYWGLDQLEQGYSTTSTRIQVYDLLRPYRCSGGSTGGFRFISGDIGDLQPDSHRNFGFTYSPYNRHAVEKIEKLRIGDNEFVAITGSYGNYLQAASAPKDPAEIRTEIFNLEWLKYAKELDACQEDRGDG